MFKSGVHQLWFQKKGFNLKKKVFIPEKRFFFMLWLNNSSVKFRTINNKVKTKTCKTNNNRNIELTKLDLPDVIHLKFYFQIDYISLQIKEIF